MEYTQEQIDAKYNSLPKELQDAINSVEIGELVVEIGDKHDLMIDQSSDLVEETALVMLGLINPNQFTNNLINKVNIDPKKAEIISTEINDKIFNRIRTSLQKMQEQSEEKVDVGNESNPYNTPTNSPTYSTISAIEQAGNFTLEKQSPVSSPQYSEKNINKESILKGIEDPETPVVNMIDHLLTTPMNNPEKIETKTVTNTPRNPIEKKEYSTDPYREQI